MSAQWFFFLAMATTAANALNFKNSNYTYNHNLQLYNNYNYNTIITLFNTSISTTPCPKYVFLKYFLIKAELLDTDVMSVMLESIKG